MKTEDLGNSKFILQACRRHDGKQTQEVVGRSSMVSVFENMVAVLKLGKMAKWTLVTIIPACHLIMPAFQVF